MLTFWIVMVILIGALQFDPGQLHERAFFFRRTHGEATIKIGDEDLFEVAVGALIVADLMQP